MRTKIPRGFGFSQCFVCGPDNPRGLHLQFDREDDSVVATFIPSREYGGYGTILHGGVTSMLLDEAMAWAVYGLLDRLALTAELRVKFLGPVRCGQEVTVSATIEARDERVAQAKAEMRDAGGRVLAEGTGTMRFVSSRVVERMAQSS